MDGSRFDELTRTLAGLRSRRSVLRAAGAVLSASVAMRFQRGDAAACRADGAICRKSGDCCSGTCGPKDATGRQRCGCPAGSTPLNGSCCPTQFVCGNACLACGSGLTCCPSDGVCANLNTDSQHCGSCDNAVDVDRGEVCCQGAPCSSQSDCQFVPTNTQLHYCAAQPTATSTATATPTAP